MFLFLFFLFLFSLYFNGGFVLFVFETGCHNVAQVVVRLTVILLLQFPECWIRDVFHYTGGGRTL